MSFSLKLIAVFAVLGLAVGTTPPASSTPTQDPRSAAPTQVQCQGSDDFSSLLYETKESLARFEGCTYINGSLQLDGNSWATNITRADLEVLRDIQEIENFLYISGSSDSNVIDLSFLRSLERVWGQATYDTHHGNNYAVYIRGNQLTSIGLRNFVYAGGNVAIVSNSELCYTDSINGTFFVEEGHTFTAEGLNRGHDRCVADGYVCDEACEPTAGCWGAGAMECVACRVGKEVNRTCEYDYPNRVASFTFQRSPATLKPLEPKAPAVSTVPPTELVIAGLDTGSASSLSQSIFLIGLTLAVLLFV